MEIVNNKKLTSEQMSQESQYVNPYHYFIERGSFRGNEYFSYVDKCIQIVNNYSDKKILDIGCGDGFFVGQLNYKCNKIFALDYSKRALEFAKIFNKERKINFVHGEMENMPFPDNSFDVVTNIAVLEHIKRENVPTCVKEITRVLKNNGILILAIPTDVTTPPKKHFQHFSIEEIKNITGEYFNVKETYGIYNNLYRFLLKLFDNRFYEIRPISKFLKRTAFYKYFANSPIKFAEMIVFVLEKKF